MDDETLRLIAEDLRRRTESLQKMLGEKVGCDEVLEKLADLRQRLTRLPLAPDRRDPK